MQATSLVSSSLDKLLGLAAASASALELSLARSSSSSRCHQVSSALSAIFAFGLSERQWAAESEREREKQIERERERERLNGTEPDCQNKQNPDCFGAFTLCFLQYLLEECAGPEDS